MVTQGSSIYEAELIDKVSGPAAHIVRSLNALEQAFKSISMPANSLATDLNVITAALKNVSQISENKFGARIGQHFNRVSELTNQLGTAIGRSMELIGRGMRDAGVIGLAGTTALAMGLKSTIEAASEATETFTAFTEVFGGANNPEFKNASMWVDDFSAALGRSRSQTQQSLMSFQAMFKGLGVTNEEAAKLSKGMTTLATDFGSFFNKSDTESLQRFVAALSGSSEVLDSFGFNIREAQLESKGLQLGLGGNVRKMDELTKVVIRAAIIADTMKAIGAEGDALRTKMGWANQVRSLTAAFNEFKISIGTLAIGELSTGLQALNQVFRSLATTVKNLGVMGIKDFINGLLALGGISAGLLAFGTAFMGVGSAVAIASLAFAGLLTAIGALAAGGPIAAAIAGAVAVATAFGGIVLIAAAIEFDYRRAFEWMKVTFDSIVSTVEKGRQVITNSLMVGDWETAWEAFKLTAENVFYELAKSFVIIMSEALLAVGKGTLKMANPFNTMADQAQIIVGVINALNFQPEIDANNKKLDDLLKKSALIKDEFLKNNQDPAQPIDNDILGNMIGIQKAAEEAKEVERIVDQMLADMEANRQKLAQEGVRLTESLMTPLEKFHAGLLEVNDLFANAGVISAETAKRAQQKLAEDFLKDSKLKTKPFQSSSLTGSFTDRIASNLGKFVPSMDPLLRENQDQTEILKQIQINTKKVGVPVF